MMVVEEEAVSTEAAEVVEARAEEIEAVLAEEEVDSEEVVVERAVVVEAPEVVVAEAAEVAEVLVVARR